MDKPNIIRAVTLTVGLSVVLALAASASASPRMTAASTSGRNGGVIYHGALSPAATGLGTASPTSTRTFAGYQTSVTKGSATVATASFTVPTLTCTTTEQAIALGEGVPTDNFNSASAAYVFTGCVNDQATYYPGMLVNGTETDFPTAPVAAGDVIDVTVKVSVNRTKVEVTDVTTGVEQKLKGSGASADAAYFGDSAWGSSTGGILHVPDFGKLTYKDCILDSKALASWRPQEFQRVNSIGTVQITGGNFWPGGTAFTTHFVHT
jgi:hypothetical protein